MNYLSACYQESLNNDGLTVMARGLGLDLIFSLFVREYSSHTNQKVVFCLNGSSLFDRVIETLTDENPDIDPDNLPKLINNEVSSSERVSMYQKGGCFFITARILVVDLLDRRIDPIDILGILVYHANRISETSIESFIFRLFREQSKTGFIKGFSEEPEHLHSGFGKIERLLKILFLKKLFLWPRFRVEVISSLERNELQVEELSINLSTSMKSLQNTILVAIKTCLSEFKKCVPTLESAYLKLDNCLLPGFEGRLKLQLEAEWHRVSVKGKQLLTDISVLKKLMEYVEGYDPYSFYFLLLKLQITSFDQLSPSLWLTSEAGEQIFKLAKERVFCVSPIKTKNFENMKFWHSAAKQYKLTHYLEPVFEIPPKWQVVLGLLTEIKTETETQTENSIFKGHVLIVTSDSLQLWQLHEVLTLGPKKVLEKRFRWFIEQQTGFIEKNTKASTNKNNKKGQNSNFKKRESTSGLERNFSKKSKTQLGAAKTQSLVPEEYGAPQLGPLQNLQKDASTLGTVMLESGISESGISEFQYSGGVWNNLPLEHKLLFLQKSFHEKNPISTGLNNNSSQIPDENSKERKNPNEIIVKWKGLSVKLVTLQNSLEINEIWKSTRQIILLKPDLTLLRKIERPSIVHTKIQLNQKPPDKNENTNKKVFLLLYEGSHEEHQHLAVLAKEKSSFENLIHSKQHMVISLPDNPFDLQKAKDMDTGLNVSRGLSLDTRTINRGKNSESGICSGSLGFGRKLVVDSREFRSSLPALLHSHGFQVIPRTLLVGDYVLSPEICVERKGLSDLFQSFASGRLHKQVSSMVAHYRYPCLLIEFSTHKTFALVEISEIASEIQINAIQSKISLLCLSFPSLRILWSRSSSNTAEIFQLLTKNHSEVDEEKALKAGTEDSALVAQQSNGESGPDFRAAAVSLLLSFPGINEHNYREVLEKVENISELSKMSEIDLAPLLGPSNARNLVQFFQHE